MHLKELEKAVPIMMYGHGTQIHKQRPVSDEDPQQGICLGFATDNYAAAYPDYYGIAKGEKNIYINMLGPKQCHLFTCCMQLMS